MVVILIAAIALAVTMPTVILAARYPQQRRKARNPMEQAFRRREFRRLDAHLEAVARDELHRLENELARYLAGRAGHVVVVSKAPDGIALELSDGRRLALRGISSRFVELLTHRVPRDMLRPESLERDAASYRLLLRGHAGPTIRVYARNVALAS